MFRLLRCTVVAFLTLSLAPSVQCAPIVTATHQFPPDFDDSRFRGTGAQAGMGIDSGTLYDNRVAQTFITEVGGRLATASFVARRFSGTMDELKVSIFTMLDGQPATEIASTRLEAEAFGEDLIFSPATYTSVADFTSRHVLLDPETEYAMVFSVDVVDARYQIQGYLLSGESHSPYPNGSFLKSQNGSPFEPGASTADLYFQVTVTPVPEPAAITLTTLAVSSCLTLRKRQVALPS
ncbi:hypothetical protein Pla175_13060 [Pirellulimonas nuda]|uniref:PEP-CTERM protein-sorting domain-containing protein n=1 Tax=Pirellulimonas nuda TaxID=2528009 RepID=A0A518D8Y2_9BACT|nr:hypothetical protein [Pirellulimonas nuda]QDU87939.1 hypothetical protein Pla175_13060 [Pirellulimonas nuda]